MTDFNDKVPLGRTNLMVGRLGVASSYKAPAEAFEEAFERGCNYFTWGSFIIGPSKEMKQVIVNLKKKGKRDELVLAVYAYGHNRLLNEFIMLKRLRALGLDYADVMILGYHPRKPNRRIMDCALKLKEKGMIRFIALSGHNRKLFPDLARDGNIDIFHFRYNAVNRGAESDIFPHMPDNIKPGMVAYTATRWGQLLDPKKMPPGELPPTSADCYRFVLTNPAVDICLTGPRNLEMMRENLKTLEMGPMNEEEMDRMKKIGDHIYNK